MALLFIRDYMGLSTSQSTWVVLHQRLHGTVKIRVFLGLFYIRGYIRLFYMTDYMGLLDIRDYVELFYITDYMGSFYVRACIALLYIIKYMGCSTLETALDCST